MVAGRITRKQIRRKLQREAFERCEDTASETCSDIYDDACVDFCEEDADAAADEAGEAGVGGTGASPRTARARRVRARYCEQLRAKQRAKKQRQNLWGNDEYVLDMELPRARSVSPVVVEKKADMPWMVCERNLNVRELQEVHETRETRETRGRRRSPAFAAMYNDGERFRAASRRDRC